MPPQSQGNRYTEGIGLSASIDGGEATLATLRAIRTEMTLIAQLSGRKTLGGKAGGDIYGPSKSQLSAREQAYKAEEKIEADHIKKMERIRAEGRRGLDRDDIETLANRRVQQAQNRRQVADRARQIEADILSKDADFLRQRAVLAAQEQDFLRKQATVRSGITNAIRNRYRDEIGADYSGATGANRPGRAIANPQAIQSYRSQVAQFQKYRNTEARDELTNAFRSQLADQGMAVREARNRQRQLVREYETETRQNTARVLGNKIPYQAPNYATAGQSQALQRKQLIDRFGGGVPPRPRPSSINPNPGGGGNDFGQARGFFTNLDNVGRITRNILLYEVVSSASRGLVNYIGESIAAAKQTVEFANALRFATEQAGGNLAENEKLAESLRNVGLSRQQGRAAVVEAARFAEERPEDVGQLTRVAADIAASYGDGIDKTDELIEQLRRRESKFFKRRFGTTVEAIYENEAARVVDQTRATVNPVDSPGLFIGDDIKIKSRTELIGQQVEKMNDLQGEQAAINYILAQSARFQGEAAERANTLAGRLDKVNASFLNAKEGVGLFITDLKLVNNVIDGLAKGIGVLDNLRPPDIGRSGLFDGAISEYDIQRYASERTTGNRAELKSFIDGSGGNLALGALGLGAATLFGRRPANDVVRNQTFQKVYSSVISSGGTDAMASAQANLAAENRRAGFFRSAYTGATSGTLGLTQSLAGTIVGPRFASRIGGAGIGYSAPYGQSIAEYRQARENFDAARTQPGGVRQATAVGGGLIGAVAGSTIGSLIADRIEAGPITATALTILGGVAGIAIGSFLGDAAGSALGARTAAAGAAGGAAATFGAGALGTAAGVATANPLAAAAVLGGISIAALDTVFGTGAYAREQERELARVTAGEVARNAQAKEINRARVTNRLAFKNIAPIDGRAIDYLTPEEFQQLDPSKQGLYQRFIANQDIFDLRGDFKTSAGQARAISQINRSIGAGNSSTDIDLYRVRTDRDKVLRNISRIESLTPEERSATDSTDLVKYREQLQALNQALEQGNEVLKARENLEKYGTTDQNFIDKVIVPYRTDAEERNRVRKEQDEAIRVREEIQKERFVQRQLGALDRVSDIERRTFDFVGAKASSITGPNNQYTEVLAEQITLADRMKKEWGFLGDAFVDYATTIEQSNIRRVLTQLDFDGYARGTNLQRQARLEARDRNDPRNLSTAEQDFLDIQSALVDKALELPRIWKEAGDAVRFALSPTQQIENSLRLVSQAFGGRAPGRFNVFGQDISNRDGNQYNAYGQLIGSNLDIPLRKNVYGQILEDPAIAELFQSVGAGLGDRARTQSRQLFASSVIDLFSDFSQEEIDRSGYRDVLTQAYRERGKNNTGIQDAVLKAEYNAIEDTRLREQLARDEQFRQQQLASGGDATDVRTAADALLLARTEGVNPRDLDFDTFKARQDALRRQAEDEFNSRQKAEKAVQEGIAVQKAMAAELQAIKDAIISGNVSMIVQVANDTEARVETEKMLKRNQGLGEIKTQVGPTKKVNLNFYNRR